MTTNNAYSATPQWEAATAAVDNAQSIVLITHISPDGDAIGSLMGLTNALRERGKTIDAVVDGGCPERFKFIPGTETILPTITSGTWDLMISLDSSDEARTGVSGIYGRANSKTVINLDHHPTNTGFGDIHIVIPTAVSATEIVLKWIDYLQHPISEQVAVPLLTGLVTDTLCFRTSNVTGETLGYAQRLMDAGAKLATITAATLDRISYGIIDLWKAALQSVELQQKVISANITQANVAEAKIEEQQDGGLVNLLLSVDQAAVSVVFRELPENEVEISLRCKLGYDVGSVALQLGGGGHKQASGATINGSLEEARAIVLPLLYKAANI